MTIWRGQGKTQSTMAIFENPKEFYFGGKYIPKHSLCRQFEKDGYCYTWASPPEGARWITAVERGARSTEGQLGWQTSMAILIFVVLLTVFLGWI